jgi:hypothetical protein
MASIPTRGQQHSCECCTFAYTLALLITSLCFTLLSTIENIIYFSALSFCFHSLQLRFVFSPSITLAFTIGAMRVTQGGGLESTTTGSSTQTGRLTHVYHCWCITRGPRTRGAYTRHRLSNTWITTQLLPSSPACPSRHRHTRASRGGATRRCLRLVRILRRWCGQACTTHPSHSMSIHPLIMCPTTMCFTMCPTICRLVCLSACVVMDPTTCLGLLIRSRL